MQKHGNKKHFLLLRHGFIFCRGWKSFHFLSFSFSFILSHLRSQWTEKNFPPKVFSSGRFFFSFSYFPLRLEKVFFSCAWKKEVSRELYSTFSSLSFSAHIQQCRRRSLRKWKWGGPTIKLKQKVAQSFRFLFSPFYVYTRSNSCFALKNGDHLSDGNTEKQLYSIILFTAKQDQMYFHPSGFGIAEAVLFTKYRRLSRFFQSTCGTFGNENSHLIRSI